MCFLRSKKIGTLDWARPFPADASSTFRANKGPASSALPWPMAYWAWALAELTWCKPFVDMRVSSSSAENSRATESPQIVVKHTYLF